MKTYNGKQFVVTPDRSQMERRYILRTIEEGGWVAQNKPLTFGKFIAYFGFSPDFPHDSRTVVEE
jgi:hypothetical protein